jgi:hypothetical protein
MFWVDLGCKYKYLYLPPPSDLPYITYHFPPVGLLLYSEEGSSSFLLIFNTYQPDYTMPLKRL